MINSRQTSKRGSCVRKAWSLPATHFNIYLNLESSLHSIITVICKKTLLAQQINRDKILFSHTRRWYQFLFLNFFLLFYVIVNFYKNYFIFNFFSMKIIFIFSCCGMFRDVPECSVFLVLSTLIYYTGFVKTWLKKFQVHFNYLKSKWNGKQLKVIS